MRVVQNTQMELGEIDVSHIKFDLRSRDDIPKILRGLQHLYLDEALCHKVFALLESEIAPKVDKHNGRPGMTLWSVLVCGVLRLDLNADYDRLHELVNQHRTLRAMLGHSLYDEDKQYAYQTLVDNVSLFTPELLDRLNQIIVEGGHILIKKDESALRGRCDSFVVETDVHFPTDINLLGDALRKAITLTARWCESQHLSDWRQYRYNLRQLKRLMRNAQSKKRRKAADQQSNLQTIQAYQAYIEQAQCYVKKIQTTLTKLATTATRELLQKIEIEDYLQHAKRQIDQIERRVIKGEIIPHQEKVFSIFEPHTEWVSKGKAGVPVELGVKVCILEDQHQFILHHHVMERQTDDQIAVNMVTQAKKRFPILNACSFDKGFHSPANQAELAQHLEQVTLPKKGKLSKERKAIEQMEEFVKARRAHSAVESAINALEVHGLDKCPDHGMGGFKRYVALAIVARNIRRIGDILWQQDVERERKAIKRHLKAPTSSLSSPANAKNRLIASNQW
ncbi:MULTISPECIES: ISNCY-like element ISNco1 family transposase [Nitrosomonas]|uniref:Transposase n=1 Tax=Nitrosomonas communis TaxID=44574 RepID=A0A0F7KKW4_9PROT|nr:MULTISPECIES: ISNCY-like element ISNco1 family transposase [Nitrosomonas]AKH39713.1 transposase [Nitrosomonas communis]UVS63474.1 ISNCY-like element ISNco1 family transposase [Nitrosomonas sp. PLL12]